MRRIRTDALKKKASTGDISRDSRQLITEYWLLNTDY